jgi:hypothetical protein
MAATSDASRSDGAAHSTWAHRGKDLRAHKKLEAAYSKRCVIALSTAWVRSRQSSLIKTSDM